eukprot:s8422_g4.t1
MGLKSWMCTGAYRSLTSEAQRQWRMLLGSSSRTVALVFCHCLQQWRCPSSKFTTIWTNLSCQCCHPFFWISTS